MEAVMQFGILNHVYLMNQQTVQIGFSKISPYFFSAIGGVLIWKKLDTAIKSGSNSYAIIAIGCEYWE